ncbi:DNA mismatch repair protein [Theileria orientalis]|uniref:DNA mismatch repair protein n=1 Tax=Theileria orientalis TaxID=68886 RepID=A0A976MBH2_THEOR|nr:DNA mismatch repair protein [Theileria orientalis]
MSLYSIEDHQSSITRSLQVINSINCVIRELVENSIDALSTQIEIKVYNGGVDLIQVSDNGSGISESDFELLASKHTTSKIKKFEDIFSSLTTFGFRGEALYSLCNLSSLEVETRVESSDHGWHLKYDSFGNLVSKNPVATNVGTCVRVRGLFKDYTVRQKLLAKNSKSQISKAVSQIQQYALINPNIGFKFTSVSNNTISTLFSTSGSNKTIRSVVEQIFGHDFSSKLIDFYMADNRWRIEGLISSPHIERGSRDLEYFYINKRPIGKTTKFKNAIASVFSHFSSRPRPSFILNLTIDYDSVDINLSPDKRSAFLLSEDYILRAFRNKLYEILTPKNFISSQIQSEMLTQYLSQSDVVNASRIREPSPPPLPEVKSESDEDDDSDESQQNRELEDECENLPKTVAVVDSTATKDNLVKNEMQSDTSQDTGSSPEYALKDFIDTTEEDDTEDEESELLEITEDSLYRDDKPFIPYENSQQVMETCDINKDGLGDHNFLDPQVFRNMKLVGQFNNSFIITKLNFPGVNSDFNYSIYIIDQHAADEKAKFETLNKSVKVNKQRLINPKLIELSPFLTQVAEQHLDLLLLNGFDTTISKETELVMYNDPELKMSVGSQDHMAKGVYVHTFPQVLGTVLEEDDLIDFINQLSSTEEVEKVNTNGYIWGTGSIPRPQKVWNILATRACKSSIRLGDPLSIVQMKTIIKNLSLLIHPWNCPHGRPSIKCLISHNQLDSLLNRNKSNGQKENDISQQATSDDCRCEGVKILDVAYVYGIGNEAFITCSDVKINLYKIYVYLTEAISRLKSMENNDSYEKCKECLSSLNFLLRRFDGYIRICMKLSEDLKHVPLKRSKNENTYVPNVQQYNKFREITSKFKVDQLELNRLFEADFDESISRGSNQYSSERLTLLWSFYRDANCSDVFALLCYTLFTANPLAYKALLENYEPCIKSHLKQKWKVLLSYIPISFEFKEYQYVFESVLFDNSDGQRGVDLSCTDENLMLSFIDWCLWRIYLIVKYTNSSYFLFIRFIKSMSKLLARVDKTPRMESKLQLLNFLKFIIKQYFIYKSLNSSVSYSDNLNIGVKEVGGAESGERMTFFEYLDLKASKKLSLFCEFEVSQSNQECECDEQYKDKHKVYKFCLHCKTSNLSNKLKSFFVLISPATESTYTTRTTNTPNTTRSQSPIRLTSSAIITNIASTLNTSGGVNGDENVYGTSDTNRNELENEYVLLNEDFGDFYSSLLSSYNSGLNDYLSGISESFMKQLNARSFEILYSLSTVLLETGFRNKLFSIFLQIVYSGSCEYNFLENYFLIKSTFNLITSRPGFNSPEDTFDSTNTLFRLLKHFCVSKDVCNSAYSGYKKFLSDMARSSNQLRDVTGNGTVNTNNGNNSVYSSTIGGSSDSDILLSVETLVSCINCQLDFVEVLLNILSLINAEGSSVLMVTPLDLMLSLVSEEHFLVLLQKILVFIIDLALDPVEFSNCMFELINLSNYISSVDVDIIHSMFFYTIASKSNLNYLNQQLQLWYRNTETFKGNGNREGRFMNNSLNCVLNVVYRMDLSCNINMFHLLLNYCKFVPENSKFYSTQCYFEAVTIYSVIDLYVNYVNSNTGVREYLSREEGNEEVKESSDKLNMLEVLSKVYKSILLFECYNLVGRKKHKSLDYKFYDSRSLIDRAFGTLLSLLNEPIKECDGAGLEEKSTVDNQVKGTCEGNMVKTEGSNYVIQVEVDNQVVNMPGHRQLRTAGNDAKKGDEVLLLVFKCILEHILSNKMYTTKLFDDLKVAIGQLCPNDMTVTLLNLVNILSDITDDSNFDEKQYLELEGNKTELTGLCVNLLVILYLGISNLLVVSNMIQLCMSTHLSKCMTFIYNNLMKTGMGNENDESEDENTDFMDDLYFQLQSDAGQRVVDGDVEDATSYLEHETSRYVQEHMTNLEINDLFDYSNVQELSQEEVYDDAYFRKSVLTMLDVNRSEKTGMRQSIGKLANKLGTNVASGFITAAIEKAEGEFLNIAKKTNKLDILKDKLFQQKKQSGAEKSMYPPILNYFEGSVLHHVSLYDQEGENELLQYRSLGEITVSRLVTVDVETACLMLMESCSYVCNGEFLRQMQAVFNENELRHAWKFLEKLEPYLVHTGWPEAVVEKISKVKSFLGLFKDFPENVTISAPSFIYNREYRLNLFKTIPSHVAVNLELVQEIYKHLALFYPSEACDRCRFKQEVEASIENIQEYLFGPLHTDASRGGLPDGFDTVKGGMADVLTGLADDTRIADGYDTVQGGMADGYDTFKPGKSDEQFDEMDEYVEVLFSVYTEIFFEDFNIQAFLRLEPLFLLNQEKYLGFLQNLYHNLTFSGNSLNTPSSQASHGLKNFASYTSISSLSSIGDGVYRPEVNNSRLIMVRRCICNFLAVYPESKQSFGTLYRADSYDVTKFLETVFRYLPEFDLSVVDNFDLFKQRLIAVLTFDNFFFIADSVQALDPAFAAAIYGRLELGLRPHSDELVDCTRLLFEYDLSNTTL